MVGGPCLALVVAALLACVCGGTDLVFKSSKELTDATLQAELAKGKPLLLNLYVSFMGSCKLFVPKWDKVGAALAASGDVTVAHVDLQHNVGTKQRLSVTVAFPLVVLVREGEVFRFKPEAGMDLQNVDTETFVAFVRNPPAGDAKPLPSMPHIEPWFTTHDFVGRDGKTYKGAVF